MEGAEAAAESAWAFPPADHALYPMRSKNLFKVQVGELSLACWTSLPLRSLAAATLLYFHGS